VDRAPSDASQPILVPRLALRAVLLAHHGSSSLVYLAPCSQEQKARRLQPPRLVVAPPAEQPPHVFKGPYLMALSSRTRHSPNHRRHIESVTSRQMLRSTWRAREATAFRPSQSATASRAWWCPRDEAERASCSPAAAQNISARRSSASGSASRGARLRAAMLLVTFVSVAHHQ